MGYGDTGASDDLRKYAFKAHADVVAAIAKVIGTHKIIIGGHDWYVRLNNHADTQELI